MNRALQQRLVGTLVLVAIVLLIAPVLFDAQGRVPEKITQIPPQPKPVDFSSLAEIEPSNLELPELPTPETVEVEAELEPTPIAETTSSIVAAVENTGSWSVQVASFRDAKKASALLEQLRTDQLQAYSRDKTLSDGTLFSQVFVGPVSTREQANALLSQIKEEYSLQGLVVRFLE